MPTKMKLVLGKLLEVVSYIEKLTSDEKCQLVDLLVQMINAVMSSIFSCGVKVEYTLSTNMGDEDRNQSWQIDACQFKDLDYMTSLIGRRDAKKTPDNKPARTPLHYLYTIINDLLNKVPVKTMNTRTSSRRLQSKKCENSPGKHSRTSSNVRRKLVGAKNLIAVSSSVRDIETGNVSVLSHCNDEGPGNLNSGKDKLTDDRIHTAGTSSDHKDYVKKTENVCVDTMETLPSPTQTGAVDSHPKLMSILHESSISTGLSKCRKSARTKAASPGKHVSNDHNDYILKMDCEVVLDDVMSQKDKNKSKKCLSLDKVDLVEKSAPVMARKSPAPEKAPSVRAPPDHNDYILKEESPAAVSSSPAKKVDFSHDSGVAGRLTTKRAPTSDTSLMPSAKMRRISLPQSEKTLHEKITPDGSAGGVDTSHESLDENQDSFVNQDILPFIESESDDDDDNIDESDVTVTVAAKMEPSVHTCSVCDVQPFHTRDDLFQHMHQNHITETSKFMCPVCRTVFISEGVDKTHLTSLYMEHLPVCSARPNMKSANSASIKLYCIYCNLDWVEKHLKKSRIDANAITQMGEDGDHKNEDAGMDDDKKHLVVYNSHRKLRNHMIIHVRENAFTISLKCPFCGEERHSAKNLRRHLFQRLESHIERVHLIKPLSLEPIDTDTDSRSEQRNPLLYSHRERHKLVTERSRSADYPVVVVEWRCRLCENSDVNLTCEKGLETHVMKHHVIQKENMSCIACTKCEWVSQLPSETPYVPRKVASQYITHEILSHALLSSTQKIIRKVKEEAADDEDLVEEVYELDSVTIDTSTGEVVSCESMDPSNTDQADNASQMNVANEENDVSVSYDQECVTLPSGLAKKLTEGEITKLNLTDLVSGDVTDNTLHETVSLVEINTGDLLSAGGIIITTTTSSSSDRSAHEVTLSNHAPSGESSAVNSTSLIATNASSQAVHIKSEPISTDDQSVLPTPPIEGGGQHEDPVDRGGAGDSTVAEAQGIATSGGSTTDEAAQEFNCIMCLTTVMFSDRVSLLRHFMCEHVLQRGEQKLLNVGCVFCPHTVVRSESTRPPAHVLWAMYLKMMGHMIRSHGSPVPSYATVYTCWKCGYETIMRCRLSQHMERQHNIKLNLREYPTEVMANISMEDIHTWTHDPRVTCESCGAHIRKSLLKNHTFCCPGLTDPAAKSRYKCDRCSRTFMTENGLNRHLRSTHEKERNILCSICGQKFFAKCDLHAHSWTIHKVNLTKKELSVCDICGEAMPRFFLSTHRMKHDTQEYMCDICGKWLRGGLKMRDHKARHTRSDRFKCHLCEYTCRQAKRLTLHHAAVHNRESSFRCQLCKRLCGDAKELGEHMDKVHPGGARINHCKICDKQLSSRMAFHNHMFVAHRVNMTKRKVEKCEECGFETLGMSLMKKHLANHRKDSGDQVVCEICQKVCENTKSLSNHKSRCHPPSMHQCPKCGLLLKTKSRMLKHIGMVHEKKKLNCKLCNYKTFSEARYKRHERNIHGIGANEENELISDIIQENPAARIESRYVPPSSARNMFPLDMTELKDAPETTPEGEAASEVYFITTDELDGSSYQLKYVVDSASAGGEIAGVTMLDNTQPVEGDVKPEVYVISQEEAGLAENIEEHALTNTDQVILTHDMIDESAAETIQYVYYYPDANQG